MDGNSAALAVIQPVPTDGKQVGGRWPKGVSGNPSGRPAGSRNKATVIAESLIDDQAEAVTEKAIALALAGNPLMLRALLDRLAAPRKSRSVAVKLPEIRTSADLVHALAEINKALAAGELDLEALDGLTRYLEAVGRAIDAKDLEERLAKLEEAQRGQSPQSSSNASALPAPAPVSP